MNAPEPATELDLTGLPWFVGLLILRTLGNEKCTPDHALVMADALQECAEELSATFIYRAPCERVARQLRDRAAEVAAARARPVGKPLGDFDGTLTP